MWHRTGMLSCFSLDMDTSPESVAERRQHPERRTRRTTAKPSLRVLPPRDIDPADLKNPALYINRELSWLEFNERVLAQARDQSHPLLERVKFFAITGTNLDEFFMIRVSTTLKKIREEIEDVAPDGYNTEQQLEAMRQRARQMLADQATVWNDPVSYTHLRAHETPEHLVCRLLL